MYCMKESSTVEVKGIIIYTKNNRSKRSSHVEQLQKRNKPSLCFVLFSSFLSEFLLLGDLLTACFSILFDSYGFDLGKSLRRTIVIINTTTRRKISIISCSVNGLIIII